MIGYGEYRVVSLRHREFRDEVNCDGFEWHRFRFCKYGLEGGACGASVDLVSLAFCAPLYVVCHLPPESRPPIGSFDQLYGSCYTWVAMHLRVVVGSYDGSRPLSYVSDYSSGILVPHSIDLFEFVWVDPSFEGILVLIFVVSVDSHDGTYEQRIW